MPYGVTTRPGANGAGVTGTGTRPGSSNVITGTGARYGATNLSTSGLNSSVAGVVGGGSNNGTSLPGMPSTGGSTPPPLTGSQLWNGQNGGLPTATGGNAVVLTPNATPVAPSPVVLPPAPPVPQTPAAPVYTSSPMPPDPAAPAATTSGNLWDKWYAWCQQQLPDVVDAVVAYGAPLGGVVGLGVIAWKKIGSSKKGGHKLYKR